MKDNDFSGGRNQDLLAQEVPGERSRASTPRLDESDPESEGLMPLEAEPSPRVTWAGLNLLPPP